MGSFEKYILLPVLVLLFVAFILNHIGKPETRSGRTVKKAPLWYTEKSIEIHKQMHREKLVIIIVLGVCALIYDWIFGF